MIKYLKLFFLVFISPAIAATDYVPANSLRFDLGDAGIYYIPTVIDRISPCTGNTYSYPSGEAETCSTCPAGATGTNPLNGGNTGCSCPNGEWTGSACVCAEGTWENGVCNIPLPGTGCVTQFASAEECMATPTDPGATGNLHANPGTRMCHCYTLGGFFVDNETNIMQCGCPGFYSGGCDTNRYTSCGKGDTEQGGIPYL